MKILFLGAYDDADIILAPIKVGKELFKNLSLLQVNILYLCYFDDGRKYTRIKKLFGFEKISERVFRSGIFPLLLFVIKYKPDIIQIVTPDAFYIPLFLLKPILKFKLAYLSHSMISYSIKNFLQLNCYQKLRFRIIEKIVLRYSDVLEVLSNVEVRFLTRLLKVKNEKIRIVGNGLNPYGMKKEYTERSDVIKIIFVGSINRKEKSFVYLLDALSEINYRVSLSVYSYEEQAKGNIEIPNNVQLYFGKPLTEIELRKEFCKNDLFIIPSRRDTFPLSLLEAMDTGILFISSDRVGLTERFPELFKQFVVPYGNKEVLSTKILEIHNYDIEEKNKLADNIRDFVSNFTWTNVTDAYIKIYYQMKLQ